MPIEASEGKFIKIFPLVTKQTKWNKSMPKPYRKFIKARLLDIGIIAVVLGAFEIWSSRHLRSASSLKDHSSLIVDSIAAEDENLSLWQKDEITLVYVFAPWCKVCYASASNINSLASSESGIRTVSLALSWTDRDAVSTFTQESGLNTPVLLGDSALADTLNIDSFPSYLVLGPSGDMRWAWSGYTTTLGIWLRLQLARFLPARS